VSPQATAARREPTGEVTMALVTLADQSVDPHLTRVANLAPITTSCFEQFSRWDHDGKLVPALASRLEESEDHLQLVFTLRPDATFWDGTPVTASDAKWSFERYTTRDPGDTYQAPLKGLVDSVETPDPRTVVVKMKKPSTLRLSFGIINPQGWNIASRAQYERVGEDAFRTQPLGTGPFKLAGNELQQFTKLEAYTGHYERAPHVKRITMQIVPEAATRLARLKTGEAGFIDGVAGPLRQQLAATPGVVLHESPAAALTTLYFQQPTTMPYSDIRLRQALQLATDQQGLIDTLLDGAGSRSPAAHIFPVTKGYDPALFGPQPFDPAKAKALVAEAGLRGAKVKAWAYDSSSAPQIPLMMQAAAGMWRAAGLDVEVETLETGAYFDRYQAHRLDGLSALASGAWFDGEALLRTDYLDGQPFSPPTGPALSGMIEQLGQEFDETRRVAAIQAVYKSIIDGAWSVTLPWANAAWATRSDRVAAWSPAKAWAYPHAFETLVAASS
jgi:ABC-type transport system substrate-binding protein